MFITRAAYRALSAADPWVDHAAFAHGDAVRLRAQRRDAALDLVAERVGKRMASGDVQLLAPAHVEVAVVKMDVGVTNAAVRHAQQHLRSARLRRVRDDLFEGCAVGDDGLTLHDELLPV